MSANKWKIRSSERVLSSALSKFETSKIAIAWTGGKDSTVILHMIRILQGTRISLPVVFIDTGLHFDETLKFVKKIEKEWKLNLYRLQDKTGLANYKKEKNRTKKKEIARKMKIKAIKRGIKKYKWKALIIGIRWDEHQARANEVYFSRRKDHIRIHPILHFTEKDIWDYIKEFNISYNPLYDLGYRSIGEKPFTKPVKDKKLPERAGREKEKEKIMKKLRLLGYF
jgi:phosphoadenosine phosphosulfate reductase